jgi:glycosidase
MPPPGVPLTFSAISFQLSRHDSQMVGDRHDLSNLSEVLSGLADLIETYEAALPERAWPNWVLSTHDRARIAARVGPEQARVAAMLLLTLWGTPTLYYGDELGIGHVEIAPTFVRDLGQSMSLVSASGGGPARTPMQWGASAYAGFSKHEPWLPLTPDHEARNVAVMSDDKASILPLVRSLLEFRREHESLSLGGGVFCRKIAMSSPMSAAMAITGYLSYSPPIRRPGPYRYQQRSGSRSPPLATVEANLSVRP